MIWVMESAEHAFAFVFSCLVIPFVIRCFLSLTVMEGKQSLVHKKGLMRKVGWMNSSLEQKLGLRNRIKHATKPGQGERPRWDLASAWRLGPHCFTVPGNARLVAQRKDVQPNDSTLGIEAFGVKGLRDFYFILKGRTQSRNNMASSSDCCSCFQILKTKWTFSTQAEHPQGKGLTDSAVYQLAMCISLQYKSAGICFLCHKRPSKHIIIITVIFIVLYFRLVLGDCVYFLFFFKEGTGKED